jgi:hypothetical protein
LSRDPLSHRDRRQAQADPNAVGKWLSHP